MPKINIFGDFFIKNIIKKISNKDLLDNSMTNPVKTKFSKNIYEKVRKTLSKA